MANLVTQSLKILSKATASVGKEYTSNLTSFLNDAKDVKNTIMNAGTDAADTYAKLKRTNITKAIHDWFYQEESDSEMELNTGKDEFDAGFSSDDDGAKLDGDSPKPTVLTSDAMTNISNKQTNAIIKVGRRQTEQSVANTAEIVSSLNSRSAEMLTAVNNINKTLLGISSRLDKIIELQAVPLTSQQQEVDKGGLYQDGKLSLMRIFEQSKNSLATSGPMSYLQLGLDALRQGQLGPSALAAIGVKAAAQKITINGKSFDDWGNAFNEMIGTATQTAMNEMINSKAFKKLFPGLTSFEGDKDYGTIVPNHYDNKKSIFDGMTRMSIVNVIPEMLAKINQSISGQEYHLDSRGKWIAGPMKNEFNEVTRASFQSGGLSAKMSSRISNAGVQSIGKKIPSEDIKDASEALTMAMVMKLHHDGDRAFSASRIKTELAGQVENAVAVLSLIGRGDADYWYKVCQVIVMQLSSGMMDSAGFVTNINQSLQKMISDATNFAQSGKANASQATKLTFNMAANQFLAAHGAPAPTGVNNINNNGTLASANGTIVNPGETLGKFSTGQYVSGIFYLLNRGINVRIDKDAERYESISLAQVRPDAKPYVSDDTFGKMLKKGLTGKPGKLDNVARDAVKNQMGGSDNTPSGFISKFLSSPAMALSALSKLFNNGPGGLLEKAKDKAKDFLGEERYNKVADKLGGLKDRVIGDERFQNLKTNAQEKLDALKNKASEAGNKIGHTRVVNNMAYAADSVKLRSAEDTVSHYKSEDEHDNIRAAAIKGLCEKGKFDLAEEYLDKIKNPTIRQAFQDIVDINKKRKRGEEAAENGEEADIGSVLIQRVKPEDDDGTVSAGESQKSILGRMLGMVGKIAKGVAKLAARGAIDLTVGLKQMAQGLLLGYNETDADGNTHRNKGLIRNLTTVPMGAMAKGAKKAAGAIGNVAKSAVGAVKDKLSSGGEESILNKIGKKIDSAKEILHKQLEKLSGLKDFVKDKIGAALDKIKNTRLGQAVGKIGSKIGGALTGNRFMKGFTSSMKEAKEVRDKLLNKKKRDEAIAENPLQAEQSEMMEGKKPSIFTKIHELLLGISGSVTHQEQLAEDSAEKEQGQPQGNPDVGDVNENAGEGGGRRGLFRRRNSGGDSGGDSGGGDSGGGGGALGGIKSLIGDVMGNFGKMMGGMVNALMGIGELVISIVTSLEAFGALQDMVKSILTDGLQPLNEAFEAIMEAIKPLVETLKGAVTMIAKVVVSIAKSLIDVVQPIIEAIMPIIQTVIDLLSPILKIIEVLMNVIMIPIKIALDIISPVIEGIGYTLQVVSGVLQIGLGAVLGLLGGVVSGLGLILSAIGSIPLIPGNGIKKSGESLKATGKDMLEMSKTMMSAGAEQIKQGIQGGISLIQRLIPGGEDGTKEEPEEQTYEDKRKAQLSDTDFGSGDVTTINNTYSYTYGSGNTTMNQHSYGSYMNMSDRGCGPVALADAYGRRTGMNVNPARLAASMNGAGQYDTRRGTSVASMVSTGNAMGMGMRIGGVTAASISQASPTNPVTVLGSGQGFGTRSGNNHYVNVVGTDNHGTAFVSNPMTGRVERQSVSNVVLNSKLGLYGSGDEDLSEYGFSDDAMSSLSRLKDITSKLTSMFTGESDAEKKINDANAEQKAKEIKRTLGDDYDAVEQEVIAKLREKYPDYTDEQIQNKLNSREGWNLIRELGGQKAADLYTDAQNLIKKGGEEVGENLTNITSKLDAISISTDDVEGSSVSGATMASFEPILHKVADFPQDGSGQYDQSPVHDFFNATKIEGKDNWRLGGGKGTVYSSSRGGWYKKYKDPHTTEGEGTSGDEHEGVLLRYTGDGTALAKAITGGTVTYVTKGEEGETTGLGNAVKWRDSGGMYHWYLHMNSLDKDIQEGSNLEPGQLIGYFGNSGMDSDGKYLRYIVTSAGPQGNTGDPGHMNPFTFWQFREEADLSTGDTEEKTYKYLVSKGMSPIGAAGMMGCFKHESNFQYDNLENVYQDMMGYPAGQTGDAQYAADVDSKKESRDAFISGRNLTAYAGQTPGAAVGFGIAQFTSQNLKSSLYDNTVGQGKSITDIPGQLDEVLNVLQARGLYDQIKGASTPTDANKIFLWKYEAGTGYTSDEQVLGAYPWMLDSNPNGVVARHQSAEEYYNKYKDLNVAQGSSSGSSGGGKFIAAATNPGAFGSSDILQSAAEVFAAWDGGTYMQGDSGTLTLSNGSSIPHFRPDCSGSLTGVIRNMGYDVNIGDVTGFRTYDLIGQTSNNAIYKNGQPSQDWVFLPYQQGMLQAGDIIVAKEHMGMYVTGPDNTSWGNRGYDGGATSGFAASAAGGKAYLAGENDWETKLAATLSGADTGDDKIQTVLRFVGVGTNSIAGDNANRGGLTFKTGVRAASESGKTVAAIQQAGGMANYVKQLKGDTSTFDLWNPESYRNTTGADRNDALDKLVEYHNATTKKDEYYHNTYGGKMTRHDMAMWMAEYINNEPREGFSELLSDLHRLNPGSGDVSNSWYDALYGTNPSLTATTEVPPIDQSKLTDDTGLSALQQYTNKYNIRSSDANTTDMLNKLENMTFNVRAKRVEELLEILINKVDGGSSGDEPLPNMFDEEIPDAVTRLSIG